MPLNLIAIVLILIIMGLLSVIDEVARLIGWSFEPKVQEFLGYIWNIYVIMMLIYGNIWWAGAIMVVLNVTHHFLMDEYIKYPIINKIDSSICLILLTYSIVYYAKFLPAF